MMNRVIEKSKERIKDLEEQVKDLEGWRRNAAEQGQDLDERLTKTEAERDELKNERDRSRGAGLAHADKLVQLEDAYGTDKFEQVWKIVMKW